MLLDCRQLLILPLLLAQINVILVDDIDGAAGHTQEDAGAPERSSLKEERFRSLAGKQARAVRRLRTVGALGKPARKQLLSPNQDTT